MPLFGTLKTMPLPDLLQWLGGARKTGTLQVERNRVHKWILMQDGKIVGCSSDDPPERLGHFLLSRGKITEDQLRIALAAQDGSDKFLGKIFIEMGALTPDDLAHHLEAKAEETIYSVFDWDDAVFRFHEQLTSHESVFEVDLRVEDVLLRGMKRYDDLQRIREVLHDRGMVLAHTPRRPPEEIFANNMARSLYEAIDGDRTVAEILLHVHGSEYLVTKFLFELLRNGFLEITAIREVPGATQAMPPEADESIPEYDRPGATPATPAPPADIPAPLASDAAAFEFETDTAADAAPDAAPDAVTEPADDEEPEVQVPNDNDVSLDMPEIFAEPTDVEAVEDSKPYQFEKRMERVRNLMAQAEYHEALNLLTELYEADPNNDSLRRLTAEAEAAFIEKAYRHYVPPQTIPVLLRDPSELESEKLSPSEFFLLSRFDGKWDVRSIIQIAPLREVEALMALKRMRERGIIELREREDVACP